MAGQVDSLKSILYAPFAIAFMLVSGNSPWDATDTISIGVLLPVAAGKARTLSTGSEYELIESIHVVERDVRKRFPRTAWPYFEPDVED